MSRLDSMLRRLNAQRDGLNWAAAQIGDQSGDVLDLSSPSGRCCVTEAGTSTRCAS